MAFSGRGWEPRAKKDKPLVHAIDADVREPLTDESEAVVIRTSLSTSDDSAWTRRVDEGK